MKRKTKRHLKLGVSNRLYQAVSWPVRFKDRHLLSVLRSEGKRRGTDVATIITWLTRYGFEHCNFDVKFPHVKTAKQGKLI